MSAAELVRRLAAAGAPPEAIAIALEAVEEAEARVADMRAKEAARSRRYRERGGGVIPEDLRRLVFERDGFSCQACGSVERLECDHIHPVSKGGETSAQNLQVLCRTCNARKRDRIRKADVRGMSADAAGISVEASGNTPSSPPPSPKPPTTPAPTPGRELRPRKAASVSKSKRCPEDWSPSPADLAAVEGEGFSPGEIARELAKMRDWQFRDAHSDWGAVFRGWIRRAADNRSKSNPKPRQANDQPSRIDQRNERAYAASEVAIARRTLVGEGCG